MSSLSVKLWRDHSTNTSQVLDTTMALQAGDYPIVIAMGNNLRAKNE